MTWIDVRVCAWVLSVVSSFGDADRNLLTRLFRSAHVSRKVGWVEIDASASLWLLVVPVGAGIPLVIGLEAADDASWFITREAAVCDLKLEPFEEDSSLPECCSGKFVRHARLMSGKKQCWLEKEIIFRPPFPWSLGSGDGIRRSDFERFRISQWLRLI